MSTEVNRTRKDGLYSGLHKDTEVEECEACFNQPEANYYRLRNCGHLFCIPCLEQLIELCMQDDTFPIPCCKDGCKMSLSKMDAFNLLTFHNCKWITFQFISSRFKRSEGNGLHKDTEVEECEACFNQPEANYYRLSNCGHLFCILCLKQLIELCMQDDTFPIPCCKDGCKMSLSKMDAFNLFTFHNCKWITFQFISSRFKRSEGNGPTKTYRTCPTPTCRNIYRVPENDAEIMCRNCKTKICTVCKNHAHEGYSCTTWETCNDAKHVETWAKMRGDIKQCPNCKIFIEKNGGCENMVCLCGTGFKWV